MKKAFRDAVTYDWLPAIKAFLPDMIFVSAGFDAHSNDPLADINLQDDHYAWMGSTIRSLADTLGCHGVVIALEGGYDLEVLKIGSISFLKQLML